MSTTEQVSRSALGALNSDASFLLACSWVSERYAQIVSKVRFKHLRRVGEFTAPGVYSIGTISVSSLANTVIGTGTTFPNSIVGRHFRAANSWYKIAAWISATELRLESSYTESSVTNGAYVIAARFIDLHERARWIGNVIVMARTRWVYTASPLESLDLDYPGRLIKSSSRPEAWAEIGSVINADGRRVKQIELYPPLTNDELFYYLYWELPTDIKEPESQIPPEIDLYVLKEAVLIDVMRQKMSVALDKGAQEVAAHWRNEYRAQETRFKEYIMDAIKADKGVDDSTLVLQSMNRRVLGDIKTARDDVWSRGNWP